METRATSRPGIPRTSKSPSSTPGSPPQTRNRSSDGKSPLLRRGHDTSDRSHGDLSSDDDDEVNSSRAKDEVDRSIPRSSRLYPDLSPSTSIGSDSGTKPDWSPDSKRPFKTPEDSSFVSARSQCIPRRGHGEVRKGPKAEIPLTPEKGSPGRKIYPDLAESGSKRKQTTGIFSPIMSIVFVGLIVIGILTLLQSIQSLDELPSNKPYIKPIEEVYKDIKSHLRAIKMQFSQTKHFWVQLIGQLETIMIDRPIQPAVILSVVPEGAEETAVCLLHKISQAISDGFDDARFIMYDVKSEVRKGSQHLKKDLYHNLLRLHDAHAAIVHNIEVIPGEAAMTFHAFCDNENAPYKQAVIILVISIPGRYEDLSWERLENTIDDYLKGKWGEELMEKDVSAVVSRVANAPVLIKPESSYFLETVCQNL